MDSSPAPDAIDLSVGASTIASAGAALTAAGRASPDAPVRWCPGWTVASVVEHIGLVHQWAGSVIRERAQERPAFASRPEGLADEALADWANVQRTELLAAFDSIDPDEVVWAFGAMAPARFWWRRQMHETAVHAFDATAAAAAGNHFAIPADVADDGLDEVLERFVPRAFKRNPPEWGTGKTIHFHRTDGDGERLLTIASPPAVTQGHAKGDLAVRGAAAEVLLWSMNRPASVELFGDTALADAWAANVRF